MSRGRSQNPTSSKSWSLSTLVAFICDDMEGNISSWCTGWCTARSRCRRHRTNPGTVLRNGLVRLQVVSMILVRQWSCSASGRIQTNVLLTTIPWAAEFESSSSASGSVRDCKLGAHSRSAHTSERSFGAKRFCGLGGVLELHNYTINYGKQG